MIRRECFLNKIHELKYAYKEQLKRTQMYRKIGGTHCIFVPMRDLLDDEFVASALYQAGCKQEDIQQFIGQYSIAHHSN
jgi:hypothetical protein